MMGKPSSAWHPGLEMASFSAPPSPMIKKITPGEAPQVTAAVDGRIMYQQDPLELILLTLQPGDSLPLHTNPSDVLFAGIEGSPTLLTPDQSYSLLPGEVLLVSSSEQRGWSNTTSQPCRILVIKNLNQVG